MDYKSIIPNNVPWLAEKTILLAITGSHAYGTNTETSDTDYKGVCIPPKEYYLGLNSFNEYNNTGGKNWKNTKDDVDISIMHINKFVKDAMAGVPNNIELLFMNPEHLIHTNEFGQELIDHRHDFLSKAVKHKMSGYAFAQRERMINGTSGNGRKDLIEKYGYDSKFASHGIRLYTSCIEILETCDFSTYRPNREFLLDIRNGKYTMDEVLEMMDEYNNKINRLYETSELRHSPDYDKINTWLIDLNERALK